MVVMGEGVFHLPQLGWFRDEGPSVWADLFVLFSGQLSGLAFQDASHAVLG
jgi:hypothetical protein